MRAAWMVLLASTGAFAGCPPAGSDLASLQALKAAAFQIGQDTQRQAMALALVDCLSHPDPAIRDGIAFEAQSHWLRSGRLDEATRRALLASLEQAVQHPDPHGFGPPFAILALSEVARSDRIAPWLTPAERTALLQTATRFLRGVRDRRGFVDGQGWRHGAAHGADLAMQLALNPAFDKTQLDALLDAVASQVRPDTPWVHGESERLARPVWFIAARGLHSADDWRAWFARLAAPAPLPDWNAAFGSEAGLAQRHNLLAFLRALYVTAAESADPAAQVLLPALRETLARLP